jgi:hypothetical protein
MRTFNAGTGETFELRARTMVPRNAVVALLTVMLGGQAADPLKSHARFLSAPSRRGIVSKGKRKYPCAPWNEPFRTAPIIKDVAAPAIDMLPLGGAPLRG